MTNAINNNYDPKQKQKKLHIIVGGKRKLKSLNDNKLCFIVGGKRKLKLLDNNNNDNDDIAKDEINGKQELMDLEVYGMEVVEGEGGCGMEDEGEEVNEF